LEACQLIPLFSPQENVYFKEIVGYMFKKVDIWANKTTIKARCILIKKKKTQSHFFILKTTKASSL